MSRMPKQTDLPRILMIAPLPPPVHGSAMMTQYIRDSKLINDSVKMDWVNLSTSRKMDEIGKRTPKKILRFASSYLKTFWKLLIHRYDACYIALTCHGGGFLKDAPFALMCKLFGKKLIIHQHNKGMSKDVDKPLFNWLFKKVYKDATVILLSWRLYPDIERIVSREQVKICPNGIPLTQTYPKDTKPHVPRILFLSNLLEAKGVFVLLDACKILKEQGYKFNCRFVGGETMEIDAARFDKEVKRRGLDDFIVYAGKRYGEEKDKEFAQADIFTFPTLNEAFGLVLCEAMQQSTPVIGTDEGAIPDIIDDCETGLIAETGSPIALAEKVKQLLDDPDFAKILGDAGKSKFLEKYELKQFESALYAVIQSVSGGGKFVEYIGKRYGEEKDKEFANADMFVFPTYYSNECFPVVILEAMQAGLPVVSTDEGGIPDIVDEEFNGLIAEKNNPRDLSEKIKLLLNQPTLSKTFGENGKTKFDGNYTLEIFENHILSILNGVITQ